MNKSNTIMVPVHKTGAIVASQDTDELMHAFSEFMRLDVAEGDASPETIRAYHANVKAFVDWCDLHGIHPTSIGDTDLKEYRKELTTRYAHDSIASKLAAVRRFYTMMHARGFRLDNPAQGLKAPKDKTNRAERIKYLNVPEAARVLSLPDVSKPNGKRDRAILSLFVHNGPRVSEVAALDIADIDLDQSKIVIRHGKGGKMRTLLIEKNMIDDMRTWLSVRGDVARNGESACFVSMNHDPNERGKRMTVRAIRMQVDSYLTRANCKRKGVSCHSLRHTFATFARTAGAQISDIGDALGHSSYDTTQVYAKLIDQRDNNPARFVAELLGTVGK